MMLIDQCSAQRYTVFAAFVNLFLTTRNDFYKDCAEVFCQSADTTARTFYVRCGSRSDVNRTTANTAYVGIMQHLDGSRSYDWSVTDAAQYQALVDERNELDPVVQGFFVPAAYQNSHQINWSELTITDLDRAGCGTTILYPRTLAQAKG